MLDAQLGDKHHLSKRHHYASKEIDAVPVRSYWLEQYALEALCYPSAAIRGSRYLGMAHAWWSDVCIYDSRLPGFQHHSNIFAFSPACFGKFDRPVWTNQLSVATLST